MKIITPDKAYVQLNDIMYLLRSCENLPIPAVIFERCFSKPLIVADHNRYEFVEFTEPEAIEFFKNWTCSVDFLALQQFTNEELMKQGTVIAEQMNAIANKYNAMMPEERTNNYSLVNEHELLEFKMYSIRDVVWFRQGHLKFRLPNGIKKDGTVKSEEKGIKKFFKRFKPDAK